MAISDQDPMNDSIKTAAGETAQSPEAMARQLATAAAAEKKSITLNMDAALYATASERNLGDVKTNELYFDMDGKQFTAQGFTEGILYVENGNWGDIRQITWA